MRISLTDIREWWNFIIKPLSSFSPPLCPSFLSLFITYLEFFFKRDERWGFLKSSGIFHDPCSWQVWAFSTIGADSVVNIFTMEIEVQDNINRPVEVIHQVGQTGWSRDKLKFSSSFFLYRYSINIYTKGTLFSIPTFLIHWTRHRTTLFRNWPVVLSLTRGYFWYLVINTFLINKERTILYFFKFDLSGGIKEICECNNIHKSGNWRTGSSKQ